MVRIPFSSTVLQRRRGYRRVLRHFSRIRLAPTIPVNKEGMRDLLELKNIALLYELWTFFRLAYEISAVLGSPPARSGRRAAISSRPISQPARLSNGIRACASCTTSASPGHGGDGGSPTPTPCR